MIDTKAPVDPEVSRFPQPMSARRARFEAQRAQMHQRQLPKGHPYALVPRWCPYPVAQLVGLVHRLIPGRV